MTDNNDTSYTAHGETAPGASRRSPTGSGRVSKTLALACERAGSMWARGISGDITDIDGTSQEEAETHGYL